MKDIKTTTFGRPLFFNFLSTFNAPVIFQHSVTYNNSVTFNNTVDFNGLTNFDADATFNAKLISKEAFEASGSFGMSVATVVTEVPPFLPADPGFPTGITLHGLAGRIKFFGLPGCAGAPCGVTLANGEMFRISLDNDSIATGDWLLVFVLNATNGSLTPGVDGSPFIIASAKVLGAASAYIDVGNIGGVLNNETIEIGFIVMTALAA